MLLGTLAGDYFIGGTVMSRRISRAAFRYSHVQWDYFPSKVSDDDLRDISAHCASLPGPDGSKAPDAAPQDADLGAKIAQGIHCTNCHGDHFEGVDNIGRLAGQREDYVYKALRDFKSGARTATGAAGMTEVVYPLGDTEMKALAHYVSRLH